DQSGWGWSLHQQLRPPERQPRRPGDHPTVQRQLRYRRRRGRGRRSSCHKRTAMSPWPTKLLQALSFLRLLLAASIETTGPKKEGSRGRSQLGVTQRPRLQHLLPKPCAASQTPDRASKFRRDPLQPDNFEEGSNAASSDIVVCNGTACECRIGFFRRGASPG